MIFSANNLKSRAYLNLKEISLRTLTSSDSLIDEYRLRTVDYIFGFRNDYFNSRDRIFENYYVLVDREFDFYVR